jgi:hypothetical protein
VHEGQVCSNHLAAVIIWMIALRTALQPAVPAATKLTKLNWASDIQACNECVVHCGYLISRKKMFFNLTKHEDTGICEWIPWPASPRFSTHKATLLVVECTASQINNADFYEIQTIYCTPLLVYAPPSNPRS